MQTVASLFALVFALAVFGLVLYGITEPVVIEPVAPSKRTNHYSGGRLPKRPEGRQALKAEILLAVEADPVLIPAPPIHLHTRREHDDWRFTTDEFQIAWDDFFDGEPDDEALQRAWRGTGRVRVEDVDDQMYEEVMSG